MVFFLRTSFSSVLDRISFIFDPNIKVKKTKFAEFSALAFCNWAKLSNFSRLEARIIQMCHGLLLWLSRNSKWTSWGPKWPYRGPMWPSKGPIWLSRGPKRSFRGPKWTQRGPKQSLRGRKWVSQSPEWPSRSIHTDAPDTSGGHLGAPSGHPGTSGSPPD